MSSAFKGSRIRLRPREDTVHISRGRTVLAMSHKGTISGDVARQGLYVYQTRVLSRYRWTIDGKEPQLSVQSPVEQHSWLAYYYQAPTNCKETPAAECDPLQQSIALRIARVVGEGMHEDIEVTNYTQIATSITLALEADADFVAHAEAKDGRKQFGEREAHWEKVNDTEWRWRFDYHCEHRYHHQDDQGVARLHRGIALRLRSDSQPAHSGSRISFTFDLKPHQSWKACLIWEPTVDGKFLTVDSSCCNALLGSEGEWARKTQGFLQEAASFRSSASDNLIPLVQRVLDRSRLDLAALRLFDLDKGKHNWKLAAGVPSYMALFGRDMLAASWQASLVSTDMSWGAMDLLAKMQAQGFDDWRDEQPGRILHESHTDPLSVLNFKPQGLYYGSANSGFLYPIVASELWHWTGDKRRLRPYIRVALDALAWSDKYLRDDRGFYSYKTRSEQGLKNQGWKDSSDAIVYPDGSQVKDPISTCELQSFAYTAKLHFSELLWWCGELEQARRLYHEAEELKKRFMERFWMEDEGYVAMAIDSHDRLVKTISSDAGHCLLSGILDGASAARIAYRLMQPDLFSGWGIRTLSSQHPAYNPFAYHRGTVWPVENGGFVLGMARYGLHGEMWTLARALFEAAAQFDYDRLPELFGGDPRDEKHPFPCLYEKADSPQAWSASAPVAVMQALLGIYPYAPLNVLFVDPHLPDWLPEFAIQDLAVGGAHVSLSFYRDESGRTDYRVDRLEGELHVLRQPSPWSLTADWGERVRDAVSSLLHAA